MPKISLFTRFAVGFLLCGLSACSLSNFTGATASPSPESESGECGNEFYPIIKGASWTYRVTGGLNEEFVRSITDVTPTGFTDQDIFSTGNAHIRKWKCEDDALIAMQPDEGASGSLQFYTRIDNFQTRQADGVTITDQLIPGASWNEELLLEGTSLVNGQDVPAKDSILLECNAGNVESISVSAGMFKAIRANCKTNEQLTLTTGGVDQINQIVTLSTVWYASDIGLVKSEQVTGNGPKIVVELTAYKVP